MSAIRTKTSCPVAGCSKQVVVNDLEPDVETELRLRREARVGKKKQVEEDDESQYTQV
jgi:hypothetical protein